MNPTKRTPLGEWSNRHGIPHGEIHILLATEQPKLYLALTSNNLPTGTVLPPDIDQALTELLAKGRNGDFDIPLETAAQAVTGAVPEAVYAAAGHPGIKEFIVTKPGSDGEPVRSINSRHLATLLAAVSRAMR